MRDASTGIDRMAPDPAAHELYEGAALYYERLAEDFDADKKEIRKMFRRSRRFGREIFRSSMPATD